MHKVKVEHAQKSPSEARCDFVRGVLGVGNSSFVLVEIMSKEKRNNSKLQLSAYKRQNGSSTEAV